MCDNSLSNSCSSQASYSSWKHPLASGRVLASVVLASHQTWTHKTYTEFVFILYRSNLVLLYTIVTFLLPLAKYGVLGATPFWSTFSFKIRNDSKIVWTKCTFSFQTTLSLMALDFFLTPALGISTISTSTLSVITSPPPSLIRILWTIILTEKRETWWWRHWHW